jgi:hypothetical protein
LIQFDLILDDFLSSVHYYVKVLSQAFNDSKTSFSSFAPSRSVDRKTEQFRLLNRQKGAGMGSFQRDSKMAGATATTGSDGETLVDSGWPLSQVKTVRCEERQRQPIESERHEGGMR